MKHILCFVSYLAVLFPFDGLAQESAYVFVPSGSNFSMVSSGSSISVIGNARSAGRDFNAAVQKAASGQRTAPIGEDPAAKAVAEKMEAQLREIRQRSVNDRDRNSYLKYIDGILAEVVEKVQRIRVLCIKASSGIMGEFEREIIQTEIDMIIDSIEDSIAYSNFNKKQIELPITPQALGISAIDVVSSPGTSLALCDAALQEISLIRSRKGAESRMLTMRIEGQSYHFLHLSGAQSVLQDANLAEVMTDMALAEIRIKSAYGTLYKIRKP